MKFARYLQETQTPEWKKAYIDYRGLKKRITAIRRASSQTASPESSATHLPVNESPRSSTSHRTHAGGERDHEDAKIGRTSAIEGTSRSERTPAMPQRTKSFRSAHGAASKASAGRGGRRLTSISKPFTSLPLHELLPLLTPTEKQFFIALDEQLEKIEVFFQNQEAEMRSRTQRLKEQLNELAEHRRRFYSLHPNHKQPWTSALKSYRSELKSRLRHAFKTEDVLIGQVDGLKQAEHTAEATTEANFIGGSRGPNIGDTVEENEKQPPSPRELDPEEYHHAKKKLKKAVIEHYRALEALKNYRILNITGFRKALKKFEKFTKIPVQHAYMTEKVETSAFYSEKSLNAMMEDMEDMYTARFEQGDRKRARGRLRANGQMKSHHFSTFRSGILLGLALPALISGLNQSFQLETRDAIGGWDALLFIYGVLLIPVLFSLLVGLNVLVWSRSRINYVFIFELDVRSRLDYREYFEIPAVLFATLCYAFWLSFSRIGSPAVSPSVWPLVWLGFMALLLFNPFRLLFKPSRYWLVRNVGRLLLSGTRRVEFADFWMGDQFCSLIFTLSNLYLFACVYARGFDDQWRRCGASSSHWPAAFALAILPLIVRVVQSLKRYADSRLVTHLVNGGKYASGILSYLFYYLWRHHQSRTTLALWCIFNTIYAAYASSWDLLMDWSVLRFKSDVKYPLLRPELVYTEQIPSYYFAIVSNVLLRFVWIFYIPSRGPSIMLRTFIGGFLEMLRRWQWNFYRLENEHLGNVDQYRITREVPLPYSFDEASQDDDMDDEDGIIHTTNKFSWLFHRRSRPDEIKHNASDDDDANRRI